jgi:FkbM family methyltransferase
VDLYEQHTEVALLGALRGHMASGVFVDVGAERGGFAHALLAYGFGPGHLIEASPANVDELKRVFGGNPDITIHGLAAAAQDGDATLHLAGDADGAPMPAQNSLRRLDEDSDHRWLDSVPVQCRSLGSLANDGLIPAEPGLVKIDVEGGDRDVVDGMGAVRCEALMIEFWSEIASVEGVCPWTLDEIRQLLEPRGLSEFVYLHHRPNIGVEVVAGAADPQPGDWGNLLFMTPELRRRGADGIAFVTDWAHRWVAEHVSNVEKEAQIRLLADAAAERLQVIEDLDRARQEHEREIAELRAALTTR